MFKRIFAIVAIIIILAWIIATAVTAFVSFPLKATIFPILAAGCIFLPVLLWIILWMVSFVTGKKNIATFNTKTNEELFEESLKAQGINKDENEGSEVKSQE